MTKRQTVKFIISLAALLLVFAWPVFASEDYRIGYVDWEQFEEGNIWAEWEKAESSTGYCVQLYKSSFSESDKIGNKINTSSDHVDFSQQIGKNGRGTYYYTVYSSKGGTDTLKQSGAFQVGTEEFTLVKNYLSKKSKSTTQLPYAVGQNTAAPVQLGWVKSPIGDYWMYRQTNGEYYKKGFQDISGQTYYFDSNGFALTGWNAINNKWYYFEPTENGKIPQCALYKNTITPDGFQVNASGVWVNEGKEQSATGKSGKVLSAIPTCTITISEKSAGEGQMRKASGGSATRAKITEITYDVPYESWQPGVAVTATARVTAVSGYYFADTTQYVLNKYSIISNTGNNSERLISFSYTPTYVLKKPAGVGFTEGDGHLFWTPVTHAKGYKLKVHEKYGSMRTVTTYQPSVALYDYVDSFRNNVSVEITAFGENQYYEDSAAAKIDDLENFVLKSSGKGNLETDKNGNVSYTEANGTRPTGWRNLAGAWYYFESGYARKEGWFQDPADGYWYYIDKNCHMATGSIKPKGEKRYYFFNDGTVSGQPYGSWVEGK